MRDEELGLTIARCGRADPHGHHVWQPRLAAVNRPKRCPGVPTSDEAYDRLHGLDGCAQSPAQALRDAARFFEVEMSRAWGGDAQWLTTGTRIAGLVADVLREEAADLDADRVAGVRRELSEEPCPACGGSMRFCECMDDPHGLKDLQNAKRPCSCVVGICSEEGECCEGDECETVTPRYTDALEVSLEVSRQAEQAERRAEDAEAVIEATRDLLDGWEHDGPDDYAVRLLIQRVREMLALGERFRAARAGGTDA